MRLISRKDLLVIACFLGIAAQSALIRAVNNDGHTDIWWHDSSSVTNQAWTMNGTNHLGTVPLPSLGAPDTNWVMSGLGDFNNDGQLDILWYHRNDGQIAVWFMNGTNFLNAALLQSQTDTNWVIVGTGYFSGSTDKYIDILWRHQNDGQNAIWLMQGTNFITGQLITTVSDLNWVVGGVGDFNGDGQSDIMWNHVSDGQNAVWYMNGTNYSSSATIQTAATNWTCVGVGYMDSDNRPDLLWRYNPTGAGVIWFMYNNLLSSTGSIDTQATNWKVGGLGDSKLDIDGDGLPDLWERNYFGNLNQGANDDFDGDGFTNLQEYLNGTDPTVRDLNLSISKPKANSNVP
jgi:hypothetical protein